MKNNFFYLLLALSLFAQSENATLTVYKDGTALIKQPASWSIPSGYSTITWDNLPDGIHRDTPFLNLKSVDIISQRFNESVFSTTDYFNSLRGENIQVKPKDGKVAKGILLERNSPTSNKLGFGPIKVIRDITNSSLIGSIGGLVT